MKVSVIECARPNIINNRPADFTRSPADRERTKREISISMNTP